MEKLLANQVALVTGTSSDIGHGIAKALADAGALVLPNYHSHPKGAENLTREIQQAGGSALAYRADLVGSGSGGLVVL